MKKRVCHTLQGVSLEQAGRFLIGLLVRLLIAAVALGLPSLIKASWIVFCLVIICLVLVDYWREEQAKKRPNEKQTMTLGVIGGAIEHLVKANDDDERPNPHHYFSSLLHHIESVIKLELGLSEKEGIHIAANIMTINGQRKQWLATKYWGTRVDGREDVRLNINIHKPLPGAPAAFVSHEWIYIPDIRADEYKSFFKPNRGFRCILSIPLLEKQKDHTYTVCAVVNIDANEEQLFRSDKFISNCIKPSIKPLLNLIVLERKLL